MKREKVSAKKRYEKPVLHVVELKGEELMGPCKFSSLATGGHRAPNCGACRVTYGS